MSDFPEASGAQSALNRALDGKFLVVNADDFGLSPGVTSGILEAHANGILTSTSLMVRSPSAAGAVEMSRDYPTLGLGLHVELYEFEYVDEKWRLVYEVVSLLDDRAVHEEIRRQYERFRELVGREPTHIDSHQHFHRGRTGRQTMLDLAGEIGVPLRQCTPGVQYMGGFPGEWGDGDMNVAGITAEALIEVLKIVTPGISELVCHPGGANELDPHYKPERAAQLRVLCDPTVRSTVETEGITLCSFAEVAGLFERREK